MQPEAALRRTIKKVETRLKSIEKEAEENGSNITELSLEEIDKIWESNKIKGQV